MPKQTLEKTFHGLQPFKFCGKDERMLCQIAAYANLFHDGRPVFYTYDSVKVHEMRQTTSI